MSRHGSAFDGGDAQLRRALANARTLADALAARETGTWSQPLRVETVFDARSMVTGSRARQNDVRGGRAAVVCWDLGHNPAGRAMVLADLHRELRAVDLVGPLWSRFGGKVWGPIEDGAYNTVTFNCDRMADFVAKAYAVASHRMYDVVHVCKPRLPGLILGSMIARASNCPIIVDIDDEELAFFAGAEELDPWSIEPSDLHEPTEREGTVLGTALGSTAASRTVSNVELQRKYGGIMVRHARSEARFDPELASREAGRQRLGAADDDFVVLFVGTPRPHKGLNTVVDALRRLADDRVVLHVVGVADRARFDRECDTDGVRVVTHVPSDMAILPELLAAGDAIALMQDLDDPISQFQIPSKISDGLSMGVPVIVSDAPPMRDLVAHGLLRANDAAELADRLRELLEGEPASAAAHRRSVFLSEFSVGVNSARVDVASRLARAQLEEAEDPMVERVLDVARRAYLAERHAERPDLFDVPSSPGSTGIDIVFFWKQNDTGIYGRRSDMLAKHFAADPRVRRVLHIDAALSTERASRDARLESVDGTDHAPLLSRELLDRRLEAVDQGGVAHRTYLYSAEVTTDTDPRPRQRFDPFTGEPIGFAEGFTDFVLAQMRELGMVPEQAIAWVCPVVPEFLDVSERVSFAAVVSDVIDDQRAFGHLPEVAAELDQQYRSLLKASDMVFTNCGPNVAAFEDYAPDIRVVPNGAEVGAFDPTWAGTDDAPPLIAYVGNMSDRIDWALLDEVAQLRPDHHFVLVGSAHYSGGVHELIDRRKNVELRGVIPYAQLPEFFRTVDVALVPHLAGPLTERMNPLKVYNYHAAGLPVVSTPIPNIDELHEVVTVAADPRAFATAIDEGVTRRRSHTVVRDEELLRSIDWASRSTAILDQLDAAGLLGPGRVS